MPYLKNCRGFIGLFGIFVVLSLVGIGVAGGWALGFNSALRDQIFNRQAVELFPKEASNSTELDDKDRPAPVIENVEEVIKATPTPTPTPSPTPKPTLTPKPTVKATPKPTEKPYVKATEKPSESSTVTSIKLGGASNDSGKVVVEWEVSGQAKTGFKVVYAEYENPTYPGSSAQFVGPDTRRHEFTGLPSGKTLHFRVGNYVGGDNPISPYSNDITVTVK